MRRKKGIRIASLNHGYLERKFKEIDITYEYFYRSNHHWWDLYYETHYVMSFIADDDFYTTRQFRDVVTLLKINATPVLLELGYEKKQIPWENI